MIDAIASIPVLGPVLTTAVPFIVALGIVVFVHEFGHYIVARWCGIRSEVFSIGFGPVVWSRRDRRGTVWQVAALPLGGYVKFLGDADGASRADPESLKRMSADERRHSFPGASVGRRMLTVLAGPAFNFLLTIVVFAALVTWQGVPTERPTIGETDPLPGVEQPLRAGDVVLEVNGTPVGSFQDIYAVALDMPAAAPMRFVIERDGERMELDAPYALPAMIANVTPLLPASKAGLRAGDLVVAVNGTAIRSFNELRDTVLASLGETLDLTVFRDGAEIGLTVVPVLQDIDDGEGGFEKRPMIGAAGASLYSTATVTPAPWEALWIGAGRMVQVVGQSLHGIGSILTGALGAENLQGPLGIAQISGEVAQQGLMQFFGWVAVVSTAIGFLNLFPIPVLDGGHFVAFLIEAVRGRPPSPAAMQVAMSIGLGLILLLMVFATYNDIIRMVS